MIELNHKQKLNKKWVDLFLWNEHPFQCYATPNVHKKYESNLQVSNLLQTPIISWIAHKFVQTI